jgi:hypothetical protein
LSKIQGKVARIRIGRSGTNQDSAFAWRLFFGLIGTLRGFPGRTGDLIGTLDDGGQLVDLLRRQVDFAPKENKNEEEEKEVDYPDYSDNFHNTLLIKNIM